MSSPFSNPKEFLEAEGPIYTFGNNSTIVTFFLIVSVVLFLWFIYASYIIKNGKPAPKNPVILSLLIAATSVSFASSVYNSTVDKIHQPSQTKEIKSRVIGLKQPWQLPMTLIGMVASGSILQRSSLKNCKRKRKTIKRNKYE